MATSAFVVEVPAAESLVGALRERFDATSKLGVPAHITLLFPFMAAEDIGADVLAQAQRALEGTAAFAFSLASVDRFPATAYLVPEPAEPFIALTQALVAAFPAFRPYAGAHDGVIPHLTVAHGSVSEADHVVRELQSLLDRHGPVVATCTAVTLLENSTGRWKRLHVFPLHH